MRHRSLHTALALTAFATLLGVAGCSRLTATAPAPSIAMAPDAVAPAPPSRLSAGSDLLPLPLPVPISLTLDWRTLLSIPVLAGEDCLVQSGRYQLHFSKGSLHKSETITIRDYDSDVLDVQFGPHGTQFGTPVELSIDFSGTKADLRAFRDHVREPVLYYLNEDTNTWEVVPGKTDWVNRRHIVYLEHFSRYVLGTKAGWKGQTSRDSE